MRLTRQQAEQFDGVQQEVINLGPIPKGSYAEVIKGPARRLDGTTRALKIDDTLVQELLTDIETGGAKDALPLLAFTLERLHSEYGATGHLTLDQYERLGRVKGSIEAAVERAFETADADHHIPRDRQTRLALLRRGMIPWPCITATQLASENSWPSWRATLPRARNSSMRWARLSGMGAARQSRQNDS